MELPERRKIKIGKLGTTCFKKGFYAYVGSAMNNLEKRVARHLKKNKKFHWHIDYFLKKGKIKKVFCLQNNKKQECKVAKKLAKKFKSIKKFGCSDCKCETHLFYLGRKKILRLFSLFNSPADI